VIRACEALTPTFDCGSVPIYFDESGLIVHRGCDGGDTAQREGWYWFGAWIRKFVLREHEQITRTLTFEQVLKLLDPANDGKFRRHPKYRADDKDWGFSRDQMTPMVAAMGVWGKTEALRRLWNALPQDPLFGTKHTFNGEWKTLWGHKLFHTGDIVGPAAINLYRRALGEDPMAASDSNGKSGEAELLANAELRIRASKRKPDDTGDDLNLIVMLLMAALRFPSKTSERSLSTYASARSVSYGSYLDYYHQQYGTQVETPSAVMIERIKTGISHGWQPQGSKIYGVLRWYHRAETGANPQLAEMYEPIVRVYFDRFR
jgi:hypothetical protein